MSPLVLVLVAGGAIASTGVAALFGFLRPRVATFVAAWGAVVGSVVGLWGAASVLHGASGAEVSTPWGVPGGRMVVGIDPLSAFFMVPLFLLGAVCAVYGRSHLGSRREPAAFFNLLVASMTLVLVARHAMVFLVGWEAMTLLAFLLVTLDHDKLEVRRAGWVYLIASHVALVALFALFLLLGTRTDGSLNFTSLAVAWRTAPSGAWGALALALVGFGVKAGFIGLHVWLPEAHAAAPSHVSALMSAVLIKLGLYGILRTTLLVAPGAWFGPVLMAFGVGGALLGVVLALSQRDLKRVLAYSSIENVGIVLIGLGLGFWAQARGEARLAAIAFGGGLLHVWNHAAMKGLMFLGAGSVLHGAGTKDMERLGGVLRRMPWTGRAMILGSVAIAGLPPFNGFTSEWLVYVGLTRVGVSGPRQSNLVAMSAIAALALTGSLAMLCFVRLVGVALLGSPRSAGAATAHESPPAQLVAMGILAGACVAGSLAAPILLSAQQPVLVEMHAARGIDNAAASHLLAPLVTVNLTLFCALGFAIAWIRGRADRTRAAETWGCGYAAPTPRMQYSARGFSELLAARALPRWLRPALRVRAPRGMFPVAATFASDAADPLTRAAYEPMLNRAGRDFARLRFLQQGNLHVYIFYVLVAVIGGLTWVAVRGWSRW